MDVTKPDEAGPVMLVVGNLKAWRRKGRAVPQIAGFHFVGLQDVTADLMAAVQPDVVLSALMSDGFDALDLARQLEALNYRGRYRALTTSLPNPTSIIAEVRGVAPGLDFDLYTIDATTKSSGA